MVMHLEVRQDNSIHAWVAGQLGVSLSDGVAIGIVDDNALIAGWVFNDYRGFDVMIHVASIDPRWMSRARLWALFDYAFGELGVSRITAMIAKKNKRARKAAEGLGFKREGCLRKAYDGKSDAIIYGMLVEDCRFWGK
jgi:RimJ/RimL family protein N-acetyltransferase